MQNPNEPVVAPRRCPEYGIDYGIYVENRPLLLRIVSCIPILNWIFTTKIKIRALEWNRGPVHSVFKNTRLWKYGTGTHELMVSIAFYKDVKYAKLIASSADGNTSVCVNDGNDFKQGVWSTTSFNYSYGRYGICFEACEEHEP